MLHKLIFFFNFFKIVLPYPKARSNLINIITDSLNILSFIKHPLGHIICCIKQKGDKFNSSLIIETLTIKTVFK